MKEHIHVNYIFPTISVHIESMHNNIIILPFCNVNMHSYLWMKKMYCITSFSILHNTQSILQFESYGDTYCSCSVTNGNLDFEAVVVHFFQNGYQKTILPDGFECEGDLSTHIRNSWDRRKGTHMNERRAHITFWSTHIYHIHPDIQSGSQSQLVNWVLVLELHVISHTHQYKLFHWSGIPELHHQNMAAPCEGYYISGIWACGMVIEASGWIAAAYL